MKTFEELEREAYIEGDVETAKLYAKLDTIQRKVDELEFELEDLKHE